jgi:tRNA modification GTPase
VTSQAPTLAACLTPPGRGAIATLAVRGPRAWEFVRELFRPLTPSRPPLPERPELGRIWLGRLGDELADEVVLTLTRSRPVPWVEIHCHGGPEVVRLLLEAFASRGMEICSWQELELRTAEDPVRAVATAELARAPTVRTAAILLDQYHGAFDRALRTAQVALEQNDITEGGRLLEQLARSIVSATPGTTRDVVTTLIAVDGWPIELADTAGLRAAAGSLEEQGIELARSAAAAAALCLWVLDASAAPAWPNFSGFKLRYVVNKTDLPAAWDLGQAEAVQVSAKSGAGLTELCQYLANWLVPELPPPGAAVPFTMALCDAVEEAYCALAAGQRDEALRAIQAVGNQLLGS